MMEIIRKASRTWVAKIFLVILVVPFLIWGLLDALFSLSESSTVISVSNQKIPLSAFAQNWKASLETISGRVGRSVSSQQLRETGRVQDIVNELVTKAAYDQFIDDIGFKVSLKRIFSVIHQQPIFHGKEGKFSQDVFLEKLAREGISEEDYVDTFRKIISYHDLVEMLFGGVSVPKILLNQMIQNAEERRDINFITIDMNDIPPVAKPSDKVLKEWFEKVKDHYRTPEYKRISYILLDLDKVAKKIILTPDDLRAEYEKRKNSEYFNPELRTIDLLIYVDKKKADDAIQSLNKGKSFERLAQEQGKSASDITTGSFSKKQIPDSALADSVFAVAKEGGYTDVIKGPFGYAIVRVKNIKPSFIIPFNAVEKSLKSKLTLLRANQTVLASYQRQKDLFAAGANIEEVAKKEKMTVVDIPLVDSSGKDIKGRSVKNIPNSGLLLSHVFNHDPSIENEAIRLSNEGYIWAKTKETVPSRDRLLSEVASDVERDWIIEQQKTILSAKAKKLVAECNKGNSLHNVGLSLKKEMQYMSDIDRRPKVGGSFFGDNGLNEIFTGPEGGAVRMFSPPEGYPNTKGRKQHAFREGESYVLFQVVRSKIPHIKSHEQYDSFLENSLIKEVFDEMIVFLKSKYDIYIDNNMIQKYLNQYSEK
ncbi:MAG: peptidylprolyl isomerase [Candidatus Liberibacter ctenarytainae]|uniref:Parvulin-like PPIase n=1 Tax=Candidatus Liberibacter ctenarytainae TaxID=2020335 RepID=A0A937DHE8_9HYPH|nr:peptidylprolyl isomerase [Candidatus Liberibacter ctenarytainae]